MGKIYGPLKYIGTIGGIRHYRMNNSEEIFAAGKGGANKNLIMTNEAFARTRENMDEMTPRSQFASKIKNGLGQWTVPIVNRYLISALNKALRIIQKKDEDGERGCKSIYLSRYKDVLNIPKYHWDKHLHEILKCAYTVETSVDRKSVTVKLSNLIPKEQIISPNEATHFKLCLSTGVVSDYVYIEKYNRCFPVYDKIRLQNSSKTFEGEWIPVKMGSMGDITITVNIPEDFVLEDDMTVLRIFGIVFGKKTYDMESLKRDRGSVEFLGAK